MHTVVLTQEAWYEVRRYWHGSAERATIVERYCDPDSAWALASLLDAGVHIVTAKTLCRENNVHVEPGKWVGEGLEPEDL